MVQYSMKNAISNFVSNRTDIFGNGSTFEEFKEINTNQTTQDGFNSSIYFGKIVYKDSDDTIRESIPVVIKASPKITNTRFVSNSFINEMIFFTKVVPALSTLGESLPSLFPQFYHGEIIFNVEGDQSVIILQDLKSSGYRMASKSSFLDRHHLMLMMRKLGEFHAYSYKAKNDIPQLFYPLANHCLEANSFANQEYHNFLSIVGQPAFKLLLQKYPHYEQYSGCIENKLQNADDIYERALFGDRENSTSIICHGDFLRNNVMFKYDENDIPTDMVFVDLATYRFSSPAIDLSTVLYLNTDQRTRNELWDTLIDEYCITLKTTFAGSRVPDKSEILSEFADKAFYAYLVASYFLPSLIAKDNNTPALDFEQIMSPEYRKMPMYQIPMDVLSEVFYAAGCEAGTEAVSDVLRDMIDRGFVCK